VGSDDRDSRPRRGHEVGDLVGNLVGMAYVVARPKGRFEIRESVHTSKGPRARSLANFSRLNDDVLEAARHRATRPFDPAKVRASARKAGSPIARRRPGPARPAPTRQEARRFVEASRRMASSLEPGPPRAGGKRDPGDALIDLLNFAEQVEPFTTPPEPEPFAFPPLARLIEATRERRTG
jgi:hypothetical protein